MTAVSKKDRRTFDFEVLRDTTSSILQIEAYQTMADLLARRNQVIDLAKAHLVSKYRVQLDVPTLIGPDRLTPTTVFSIDTDVTDYPFKRPAVYVISKDLPYSPHFMTNAPVCIAIEFWEPRAGHVTLDELVEHLAMILNWDENGRGSGYAGWNKAAISYHQRAYHGRPLNPGIEYPKPPDWLHGESGRPMPSIRIHSPAVASHLAPRIAIKR